MTLHVCGAILAMALCEAILAPPCGPALDDFIPEP